MNQSKTKTITSKDISQSKKVTKQSFISGYKVHTVTMHAEGNENPLTKEGFEALLRKVARPVKKQDEKE